VLSGIVVLNLMLMVAKFVQARNEEKCDASEQGLVIWDDEREHWMAISLPEEPTDLPPCRGTLETEFKVSSA
jgi:hypothetical protein